MILSMRHCRQPPFSRHAARRDYAASAAMFSMPLYRCCLLRHFERRHAMILRHDISMLYTP